MASSKKRPKSNLASSKKAPLLSHLKSFLRDFFLKQKRIQPNILVAYSGGLDSTVLLHAFHQLKKELPMHLRAMHVHHGLSVHADDWADFCRQICRDLDVPLQVYYAKLDQESGLGVEAAARKVRYQALNAADADYICLAQHQHDQAETLLLQLARGAGVKGLSGMAQVDLGRRLLRPFLNTPHAELVNYAKQYKLQWVEDESNGDTKFDRNFIRHEIIPAFSQQYPSITQTLARSATHMAHASEMLDELALIDVEATLDTSQQYGALRLDALTLLSEVRQGNLVRWWLANNQISMPSAALLKQILQQLQSTKADAAIKVQVADSFYVMRYKTRAFLVKELNNLTTVNLPWQGEKVIVLPNFSRLFFKKVKGQGLACQREGIELKLQIRSRKGGERFLPDLGRPRRSLKAIMQSIEMPPWQREQLPLIFVDDVLAIIPNFGVDANLIASDNEEGIVVSWEPASN